MSRTLIPTSVLAAVGGGIGAAVFSLSANSKGFHCKIFSRQPKSSFKRESALRAQVRETQQSVTHVMRWRLCDTNKSLMRSSPRSRGAAVAISETQTPRSHLRESAAADASQLLRRWKAPRAPRLFLIRLLPLIAPPSCVMHENLPLMVLKNLFVFMLLCLLFQASHALGSPPYRLQKPQASTETLFLRLHPGVLSGSSASASSQFRGSSQAGEPKAAVRPKRPHQGLHRYPSL